MMINENMYIILQKQYVGIYCECISRMIDLTIYIYVTIALEDYRSNISFWDTIAPPLL